jgi:hypothetical protein
VGVATSHDNFGYFFGYIDIVMIGFTIVGVTIVIIILIIVIMWPREQFRSCRYCDGYNIPRNGLLVINPYIYPYSGTEFIDDLYKKGKVDKYVPLTHLNTPDHVELVN